MRFFIKSPLGLGLIAALALGAGCASFQERARPYHTSMYSWLGAPVKEAVDAWGKPETIGRLDDGRQTYVWSQGGPDGLCLTTLITDIRGKIVNFNPEGTAEACAGTAPPLPRPAK